jgi:hypothetical protein
MPNCLAHPRLTAVSLLLLAISASATTFFVHPVLGNDRNSGGSPRQPLQTLARAGRLKLQPGDQLLLAAGQVFVGSLVLCDLQGSPLSPIVIGSYSSGSAPMPAEPRATIDGRGRANGICLTNVSNVRVNDLILQADGGGLTDDDPADTGMRCGVLITTAAKTDQIENITLERLWIHDVFFEEHGFKRDHNEVKTANGTQRYGWGIRFINEGPGGILQGITVRNCVIENIDHTGLKFTTGGDRRIEDVGVFDNIIRGTGGPGIQVSGVVRGHFQGNRVDRSGSDDDSRKWGRGSGLWTWGCTSVVIEQNAFTNANAREIPPAATSTSIAATSWSNTISAPTTRAASARSSATTTIAPTATTSASTTVTESKAK